MAGKKNKVLLTIIAILSCILVCEIIFLLMDRGDVESGDVESGDVESSTDHLHESIAEQIQDVVIQTPYGQLLFQNRWGNQMQTQCIDADPYVVRFCASVNSREQVRLFDIIFGQSEGLAFGYVRSNGTLVPVNVRMYDVEFDTEWNAAEKDTVYEMQECANVIIANLELISDESSEPTSAPTVPAETEPTEDIVIHTPYGQLFYPGYWGDQIRIEHVIHDTYVVEFYGCVSEQQELHLFDICFGGNAESAWGIVEQENGEQTTLSVTLYDIVPDSQWTAEQYDSLLMMQEQINYLLERIPFVDQVPVTEATAPVSDSEDVRIETPYGFLYYPGQWEEYLCVRYADDDGYAVEFYCDLPGRSKVYLFSVIFGGNKGNLIGSIDDMSVMIDFGEIELDDSWSEDEMLIVYTMGEEVNQIYESFSDIDRFQFA